MLQVEIKRPDIFTARVNPSTAPGSRQFEPFTRRYQIGYVLLTLPNGEPDDVQTKIELSLEERQEGYPVGNYQLSPGSFYVDKYRRLTLGRPVLAPVAVKNPIFKTA